MTCLLARASAAIGNTRWVVARGLRVPLSLQYVTSILAGSGKSEIRRYMRRVTEPIEAEILKRRAKAEKEAQEHADKLDDWGRARSSTRARATVGDRPTAPPRSPHGGPRVTYTFTEGSLEGVMETLLDTPRGLDWESDEAHEIVISGGLAVNGGGGGGGETSNPGQNGKLSRDVAEGGLSADGDGGDGAFDTTGARNGDSGTEQGGGGGGGFGRIRLNTLDGSATLGAAGFTSPPLTVGSSATQGTASVK